MKYRERFLVIIAILILLMLIVDRLDQLNDKKLESLEAEKLELMQVIDKNEQTIKEIQHKQSEITAKLNDWDNIDVRWLKWIEDNWYLVKTLDGGGE